MTAKQPNCRLGVPWICALTGGVIVALAIAAMHLGAFVGSARERRGDHQPVPSESLPLVNASSRNTNSPTLSDAARERVVAAYGTMPLAFEANQGQTDPRVKYLARGNGYTLFLTSSEMVMSLASDSVVRMRMVGANPRPRVAGSDVLPGVSNYFIGNDPHNWRTQVRQYARVGYKDVYPGVDLAFHGEQNQLEFGFMLAPGADPAPIRLHFTGAQSMASDASGDLVLSSSAGDLRLHRPVAYQESGARHTVDARFVVKNGEQVGFELGDYDHSRALLIDPSLSYSTALATTVLPRNVTAALSPNSRPWVFYAISLPIFGLALAGMGIVPRRHKGLSLLMACLAFSGLIFLPACGRSHGGIGGCGSNCPGGTSTLVYSSYLGGSKDDEGQAIAVDANGIVYVAGESSSSDFPGSPILTPGTGHDAFVVKVDASGARVYSTFIGGTADDDALGIAVTAGNPVVVGNTQQGTSFPAAVTIGPGGGQDMFVAKLDANGALTAGFPTVIGGTKTESANGVVMDGSGNIYVAGQTNSSDLFASPIRPPDPGGSIDAFVFELASGGGSLTYSTYLAGTKLDVATGIALNSTDNTAYVSGITDSAGISGASNSLTGTEDGFVAKFDSTGNQVYFTYVGGSAGLPAPTTDADAIAVDTTGVAFITGKTNVSDLPSKQNSLHGTPPTQDAFIAKINTGGTIAFSTYLGGATTGVGGVDADEGLGIALNAGNIFVTGVTTTTDFPVQNPLTGSKTLKGGSDAFVTEFPASGSAPIFSTFFGGSGHENNLLTVGPALAGAIAVDSTGNVYITGSTNSASNFPLQNPFQGSLGGGTPTPSCGNKPTFPCPDAFVAKITP